MKIIKGFPEAEDIGLISMKVEYSQVVDSCGSVDSDNTLTIETEDAGGGQYFIIKTDRWAINSIEEFVQVLEDFKKRLDG